MAVTCPASMPTPLCLTLSPTAPEKPTCYASPAKMTDKKEVQKVKRSSSLECLLELAAAEDERLYALRNAKAEEEEEDDEEGGASVHTYKKSIYWSKEVEEKLGLSGADPYGMLELESKRWRATPEELRKAYRRLVLSMHPDKKAGGGELSPEKASLVAAKEAKKKAAKEENRAAAKEAEAKNKGKEAKSTFGKEPKKKAKKAEGNDDSDDENGGEEEEDEEFKLLSTAWELLGNAESRRAYDSIDNFNDFLPASYARSKAAKGAKQFFATFAPPFARQVKFVNEKGPPLLGDAESDAEYVAKFYKFWFSATSWRDFALLTEHDYKEADDREERRWMQRQNKNIADRYKKDEKLRVSAFVQLAYDNDPRVAAMKEAQLAEKAAKAAAKEEALNGAKRAKEAEQKAIDDAKAAEKAVSDAKEAEAKASGADAKRARERERSALKKAKKELKALGESEAWAGRVADIELVAAVLELAELTALRASMEGGASDAAVAALTEALKAAKV